MNPDTYASLPFDVRLSILKNKPFFPQISKQYYNEGKKEFYDTYCDKPISTNEVLKYVIEDEPQHMIIYEILNIQNYYSYNIYILTKKVTSILSYHVNHITVDNQNGDQDSLYYAFGEYHIDDIVSFLTTSNTKVYYDIQTVYNIATRRTNCMVINDYNRTFTLNYIDNLLYAKEDHPMDEFTKLLYALINVEYQDYPHLLTLLRKLFNFQETFDHLPYYDILKNSI